MVLSLSNKLNGFSSLGIFTMLRKLKFRSSTVVFLRKVEIVVFSKTRDKKIHNGVFFSAQERAFGINQRLIYLWSPKFFLLYLKSWYFHFPQRISADIFKVFFSETKVVVKGDLIFFYLTVAVKLLKEIRFNFWGLTNLNPRLFLWNLGFRLRRRHCSRFQWIPPLVSILETPEKCEIHRFLVKVELNTVI